MKKLVVGILAHVDAGKTTLSESMLYLSGRIRQLGRVDHQNAFLDYDMQERNRGITIFSKQAIINWKDVEITLIDTPGHADFSAEMERTLQILDYAIVVINGLDGVQTHSETIWNLLSHYHIPTFLFINKMDITSYSQEHLLGNIQSRLDEHCFDFTNQDEIFFESIALVDDDLLDEYMEHQTIQTQSLIPYIQQRKIFPVYFGSALKTDGVTVFMDALDTYTKEPCYPDEFGAQVYKVTHEGGHRLTHVKIVGGSLKTKEKIKDDEKVDQIRRYSGHKYEMLEIATPGMVVALKGLSSIQPGEGLGYKQTSLSPLLSSYMNYRIVLPDDCDQHQMLKNLQQLSQEDPTLHVTYHQELDEIHIQLMGEIQIEILKNIIQERFHVDVSFDQGQILYKETILNPVEGVGHFEPLRHYAEVHLLLEPLEVGSGLQFETDCSEDVLSRSYQRLILTHLQEKEHLGVLTGSPITDMKITLLCGKAHQKHTEGGDFREATYRAVRQGLKMAQSILLEPYYQFRLEIPSTCLSRALYDIEQMHGTFEMPDTSLETIIIEGEAPVACMQNYHQEVIAYSKGKGKLSCSLKGYQPCHNQDEVIEKIGYDSETDMHYPTGSVFCAHGAGFYVSWDQVRSYMHIQSGLKEKTVSTSQQTTRTYANEDEELDDIFTRTYGPVQRRLADDYYRKEPVQESMQVKMKPECLLIDGYNVIHAWDELKDLASVNLGSARERLIDILSNYQGYRQCLMIIVFDAYKVKDNQGTLEKNHNVYVVYTKEAQTADMYIERVTHHLASDYRVIVATSDALEQTIVIGRGARRMSSRELKLEVEALGQEKFDEFLRKQEKSRNFLLEDIQKLKTKE
ncbi:MAG: translation factor GTPase family protein [Longibaculum muris]|uniref:Small GTP-binding protein n=1 Tax=Longibaculum muris TaxID=1796628 RepID=A0A4R3Z9J1_9FIRM|nr:TetM/TetW/TetO/TetS family tetracycline resistance ribosomal protection protein [Longibaculum muris]KXU51890.1 putative translation elongation factor G [Candidatus Stoquefichus sp. KLE1796]MCR1887054.1 TetM/TetW/TetO/TetS family tetracycline resistance ribosomal protection protein [Longibaculum muris]MED9811576.1 translation factor GTPase family protein [Longibaculum muris]TCW03085.1 small GTP-binding protein [Longibaculum muris]